MDAMEKRDKIVKEIESLFPPDIHKQGREFLLSALCTCWRLLPLEVLEEMRGEMAEKEKA